MYVRRPHQQMAYGQRLDCPLILQVRGSDADADTPPCDGPYPDGGDHPCVDRYNEILQTSPATATQEAGADPGSYMYDMMHPDEPVEGCPEGAELAAYLDSNDGQRIVLGVLLFIALLILAVFLLVGVVIPLVVGQLMVAILAVALIFVLPVALLGGGGRRVLWKWAGLLLAAVFMIVVALVGLALMLITIEALLRGHHQYYFINLLMMSLAAVLFLILQRRLLKAAVPGGHSVGGALGRLRPGGGAGAGGGGAASGTGGEDTEDGWTRAATVGYRPLNRWRRNREIKQDVTQRAAYFVKWRRKKGLPP
jgi:hypothetical protein